MTFNEQLELARKLSKEEIEGSIRRMANEPHFAAWLALMERNHRAATKGVAGIAVSREHGPLAHLAGQVFALETLIGQVQEILHPTQKRGPQPPEE